MTNHTRRFGLVIAILFGFWGADGQARAECGLPVTVIILVDSFYAATSAPARDAPAWNQRLRSAAGRVDMNEVGRRLFAAGMPKRRDAIETLLHQAQWFGTPGYAQSVEDLHRQLRRVELLDATICELEKKAPARHANAEKGDIGQATARMTLPALSGTYGTVKRISVLFGAVAAMVLLIVGGHFAYVWLYAIVHFRRTCRIQAEVVTGLDVIDGHITILGFNGCRFQPVNSGAMDRLKEVAQTRLVTLYIDGQGYPA